MRRLWPWISRPWVPGQSGRAPLGAYAVEHYPVELCWPGALQESFRCADEEAILRIVIHKHRFATHEPGFITAGWLFERIA